MPENAVTVPLTFEVFEKGQWAFLLWPWTSPNQFLYDGLTWGAKYQMRSPAKLSRHYWIEFVSSEGTHGEYPTGLYFGSTQWGPRMFRRFNVRSSHYLTHHGLDGLPKKLWDAAYEYDSGQPMGQVQITFKVAPRGGYFGMSFFEWTQYFASGRNEHISKMAIIMTKR